MTHKLKAIAERYAVSERTVRHWIEVGDLRALDVSAKRGSRKPRFVVTDESLAAFEAARSTAPVREAPPRRRKPRLNTVPNYFASSAG